MAERLPHSPCRRTDRHDAHEFEVYARPFWCPGYSPTGPACGNNPHHQMSDGDRQAVVEFRAYLTRRAALLEAAGTADELSMEIEQAMKTREVGPLTALQDLSDKLRRMASEAALSPYYEHPECGFHWHGRDGMDIPIRDGQPVCPRCELAKVTRLLEHMSKRREEVGVECKRRGKRVLEQSERILALERQIDEVQRQLGAEILRAGQAEAELRRMADETPAAETEPLCCPLCADKPLLRTPAEAHDHFRTVHPEQQLAGPGPWPLLVPPADKLPPSCPGYETVPNRCACPCEGCKHHCGAHQPAAEQPQRSRPARYLDALLHRGPGYDLTPDQPAETEAQQPRRGDQFEAWLKQQRDDHRDADRGQWTVLDDLLDRYRLHADTGTPLGEHVCEARVVGDCEYLEQPAAGARQDGAQP